MRVRTEAEGDPQQLGDERLTIIGGRQRGERDLPQRQAPVEEQQHPEQLADLARPDLGLAHETAGETAAVQHG